MSNEIAGCDVAETCQECGDREICDSYLLKITDGIDVSNDFEYN